MQCAASSAAGVSEVASTSSTLSTSSASSGGSSTAGTCRRPPTTAAAAAAGAMSFEEFVLGMLSKVGGGKAITAATQSYLRESATVSNRAPTEPPRTTAGVDAAAAAAAVAGQTRPHYEHRSTPYQNVSFLLSTLRTRFMSTMIVYLTFNIVTDLSCCSHRRKFALST